MNKRQLRALALRDPIAFRKLIHGARARELAARHLLLHPDQVVPASPEDLEALRNYIKDREWGSLYGHDRRMYRLLKAGMEKLKSKSGLPVRKSATTFRPNRGRL
jgi:hypothetical protein